MQFSLILLASLAFNSDIQVGDTVLVPRTEIQERTVREEVTVYDRYKLLLVPENNLGRVVRMPRPPIVGRFKFRSKTLLKGRVR